MKVPEGRPTIARRFNGGFRLSKPIESRRDERKYAFVRDISAAPAGLSPFVFTPTVKTVGDILDLEACSAFGQSPDEALKEVQRARKAWLEAARKEGKPIPKARYRPAVYQLAS